MYRIFLNFDLGSRNIIVLAIFGHFTARDWNLWENDL